jgi:hypothetical protein
MAKVFFKQYEKDLECHLTLHWPSGRVQEEHHACLNIFHVSVAQENTFWGM